MELKKAFYNFIKAGSVYYTVISGGFLALAAVLSEGDNIKLLETSQFLKILLFSFMMGLGYAVLRIERLNRMASRSLHAGCYILGFLLFAALVGMEFAGIAISTALFAAVYVIVTAIGSLIHRKVNKSLQQASKTPIEKKKRVPKNDGYQSQFGK